MAKILVLYTLEHLGVVLNLDTKIITVMRFNYLKVMSATRPVSGDL